MISKKPSILFISWDGPQTNYLENLFFPIFSNLTDWQFHVVQLSWAGKEKQEHLKTLALRLGIGYSHIQVIRRPHPMAGAAVTVLRSIPLLKSYIRKHGIEVLMPRSTFPAMIAGVLQKKMPHLKLVFDADGLPLEERVDFSGLDPKGFQYRFLKKQERQTLLLADRVLVRSDHAARFHLQHIGERHSGKFFKVTNGRDKDFFSVDLVSRTAFRKKLGLAEGQLLLVYTGSLGPQYGWEEMAGIFEELLMWRSDSKLLILSGNPAFLQNKVPAAIADKVIVKEGPFNEIPAWLSAADIALAIRKPLPSMKGVAPIKLGEYLLMGLPTIASQGIGDSEALLAGLPFVYHFDHDRVRETKGAAAWVKEQKAVDKESIRQFALRHFTLDKSIMEYRQALAGLIKTDEA